VRIAGYVTAGGLLAAVVAANWATSRYGFIPVGFGLTATAGTLFAGAALALRDATQDLLGRARVLIVIVVGAILSGLLADPAIAVASAAAFGIAELVDFAIYTPLRNRSRLGDRRWAIAVGASSVGGAVVDTIVFIGIAFGSAAIAPALLGQLLGKLWATLAYLVGGKLCSIWRTRPVKRSVTL
jgi:uncharacterized PurR-regulated membrane protein YhhQ (DUF165 family)